MASEDPWEALSVGEVASLLDGLPVHWWIAGGQAIDLFVGSSTRPHQDVDVAVLRPDQLTVQAHLDGWDLRVAHNNRLTPWAPGQLLAASQHGIWARPNPASPWRWELLVDDVSDGDWGISAQPGGAAATGSAGSDNGNRSAVSSPRGRIALQGQATAITRRARRRGGHPSAVRVGAGMVGRGDRQG